MMSATRYPIRANFGLLPEPERSPASFVTSAVVNMTILAIVLYVGMNAKKVIQRQFEQTELIFPTTPPPPVKVKITPPPKIEPPKPPELAKLDAPKINLPKPEPKPETKPLVMEAKVALPAVKEAKPAIVLAPQPKAALRAAAPAQMPQEHVSTKAVHLGETFGVMPNPNAQRPASVAAIGNPYGGMNGEVRAPRGVVGSTGIGNGTHAGSNAGQVGRVASAGIPGSTGTGNVYGGGRVASAGIPGVQKAAVVMPAADAVPRYTQLEVLSKPKVEYTAEARQLRVQGDVVLRVTFTANGQVIIQGVVHGLGHGLDEEAQKVAQQIRFRPATRNGQPVDLTTNITITFQLA